MKPVLAALAVAAVTTAASADQHARGEEYWGVLGNVLVSPDSARELDGLGVQGVMHSGRHVLGMPLEYRAFFDTLEAQDDGERFYRLGGGADLVYRLNRLGLPDVAGIQPFVLGGGGLVYGDAVPVGGSELDFFANVGVGAVSKAFGARGWRVRGDLKYVYENLGDGYSDLHFALGFHLPLGGAGAARGDDGVSVVPAEADSDGDGVGDSRDQCPETPSRARVMKNGCEPRAVVALEGVTFETNSDQLRDGSSAILDEAAATLNGEHAGKQVEVAGHTDDSGNAGYNMGLSLRRAETVRQYLIAQGVDESRLSAEGYGETQPAGDNGTAEGRAENRRVELRVKD